MKKTALFFIALVLVCMATLPVHANATGLRDFIVSASGIINTLIGITMTLALLFFIWGLAKFILHSGNEETIADGKMLMMWGIIALFVMTSIWGIVNFLERGFFSGEFVGPPAPSSSYRAPNDLGAPRPLEP